MKPAVYIATSLSILALIMQPRGASAQQISYSGYTRNGSFFGCGSAPKLRNGYWMITNRKQTRGSLFVAEFPTTFIDRYSWQLTGISSGQRVTMSWDWAFVDRMRGTITDKRTTTLTMTMPKDFQRTGAIQPRQCW
jgi:hypothetical protein